MIPNYIRLILAGILFVGGIALMFVGHWPWGVVSVLLSFVAVVTFFFHERMLLAQWFLRKEKFEKAELQLSKITNYETQLLKLQYGYYHLLLGLLESRKNPMQSEKYFKKALSFGMQMEHNVALAKLNLAGIAMGKRNKREAQMYLNEAKKADKNKLMADQIKQFQQQMALMDKQQQVRYR